MRLFEANYPEMFKNIDDPSVRAEINWAKQNLRKEDRIVWYLRWFRLALLHDLAREDAQYAPVYAAMEKEMRRRAGGDLPMLTMRELDQVKHRLAHFLSLNDPRVQNFVFKFQTPDEVFDQFDEFEAEMVKRVKEKRRTVETNGKPVLSFPGNWAWFDLEQAYCPDEAGAMGHCGNAPRKHSGDTILSLRKMVKIGDEVKWEPHLTFILDDNGFLGEMKGKGNDKPTAAYHKYIVPLLLHPRVDGIKGGGYMPEHNFDVNDLDDDVREEVLEKKPMLGGLSYVYEKQGWSDIVEELVSSKINTERLPDYVRRDGAKKEIVLWEGSDLDDVYSETGIEEFQEVYKLIDEPEEFIEVKLDQDDVLSILERLPDDIQNGVLGRLGFEPKSGLARRQQLADATYEILKGGEIHDLLSQATNATLALDAEGEEKLAGYLKEMLDHIPFQLWMVGMFYENPKGPFELRMGEQEFINVLTSTDDDYDDYAYLLSDVRQHDAWGCVREDYEYYEKDEERPFAKIVEDIKGLYGFGDFNTVLGRFEKLWRMQMEGARNAKPTLVEQMRRFMNAVKG